MPEACTGVKECRRLAMVVGLGIYFGELHISVKQKKKKKKKRLGDF